MLPGLFYFSRAGDVMRWDIRRFGIGPLAFSLLLASSSASGLAADPDDMLLTCQRRVGDAYLAGHVYVLGEDRVASGASGWAGTRIPVGTPRPILEDLGFDIHLSDLFNRPASPCTRGVMVTPLSNTDWKIVILVLHPGRMAMVYFFELALLEFTISINCWDTPRNNASLLAVRCRSGH